MRGINLAVVTLGAAVAVSAVVFQNADWTGGVSGSQVPSPGIFGFSLDPVTYPVRFGIFALVVTILMVAAVINLRRSPFGRRMLAVRSNERAAAVNGINVVATKLQAFALSAFIAGIGGGVLAYQLGAIAFERFSPMASITLLAIAYIGGIATVGGAIAAGVIVNGGVLYVLLSNVEGIASWWVVISGAALLLTAVTQPDGIAVAMGQQARWVKDRLRGRRWPSVGTAGGPRRGQRRSSPRQSSSGLRSPRKRVDERRGDRRNAVDEDICGRRRGRRAGRLRRRRLRRRRQRSTSIRRRARARALTRRRRASRSSCTTSRDTSGAGSISAVLQQFPMRQQAAVDHINKDLGGLDGRPFKLVKCDSKADPAATTACANQAVQDKARREGRPVRAVGQRQQDLRQGRHRRATTPR